MIMFEEYKAYSDIATVEDSKGAEWDDIISQMIIEKGDHLGEFNIGVVGIKSLDPNNIAFVSLNGKLSEDFLSQCI